MTLDHLGRPYLIWTYWDCTPEERLAYFYKLADRIAYHKKVYYTAQHPELTDVEYDYMERLYEAVAKDLGLEPEATNQVGYKE